MICNECETVTHCTNHGCIPKQPEYKGAIEVSVIFHEGQRMFAVPKQPAPMSQPNRVIAYSAAMKLRELGYEWMNDEWKHLDELAEQPAQQKSVAWTLLLVGAHNGLVGKAGNKFVGHPGHYERVDVYTSPPAQRTWVGLTDEQIEDIWADCPIDWDDQINILTFARAIEAAHGIGEKK